MNAIQNRLSGHLAYLLDPDNVGGRAYNLRLTQKVQIHISKAISEPLLIKVVLVGTEIFTIQKMESKEDSQYYYNIEMRHSHFHTRLTINHMEACMAAVGLDKFFYLCLRGRKIKICPRAAIPSLPFLQLGHMYELPTPMRITATRHPDGKLLVSEITYMELDLGEDTFQDLWLPVYPNTDPNLYPMDLHINPDYPV